jgi:glycerophosphoryl diester phosphodiesterase
MILYGHRGAKGEAPENTLSGFAYGYQVGLRAFELDVHLTADHHLAVMHDASVTRTTGANGTIAELTREQLARLDARVPFPGWPEPCPVPMLEEVFAALPSDVVLEVEIKRDEPERLEVLVPLLISAIADYGMAERLTVTSFDARALHIVRREAPHLPRGFIGAYNDPRFLATAVELECERACIPVTTGSREMAQAAHAEGIRVTGWPGNTPEQLATLVEWEVEGITTDFPGVAIPFLRERGLLK